MNQYTQLSQEERYEIYAALKSKTSQAEIARGLNRSPATISREIRRNIGLRNYRAKQAHELSKQRCYRRTSSLTTFAYAYIRHLIEAKWSPDQRQRIGDFEGDTVIGKHHKGALLTLVERKSLYVHIVHLGATRVSAKTIGHCIDRLKMSHAHSVTFDNGKEFSEHQRLTNQGIDTYFADAYCSNQRARNENTNGLIRQYLPKSSSFEHIGQERIQQIEDALNNRPRKSLGWRTPSEVMARFYTVALAS